MKRPLLPLLLTILIAAAWTAGCAGASILPQPLVVAPSPPPAPLLPEPSVGPVLAETPSVAPLLPPGLEITGTLPGLAGQQLSQFKSGAELFAGQAAGPTAQALSGELQEAGVPEASLSPFVQLFPELRRMPAPAWLQEGYRVTYRVQSASVAQARGAEGSGGAGYVQYDLVALDGRSAVATAKFYLDDGRGNVTPNLVNAMYGIPAAGDYWLNPAILPGAERVASDQLTVVRMPTTVAGRRYQAVRFQYATEGAEYVWMFDEETGLLLFYRHAIGTEFSTHRQLADVTLVGARQLNLPWRGRSSPAWATVGTGLRYEGSYTVSIPGSPPTALPYAVTVKITRVRPRWTAYTLTDYLYGRQNSSTERVTGVSQVFDGLWLPREALRTGRLRPWVDRDPITGAELRLARAPSGALVLSESGPTFKTTLTYDRRDGTLLSVAQETQVGLATTVVDLRLAD